MSLTSKHSLMKVCHPWQWGWKCNECLPAKKVKTKTTEQKRLSARSAWVATSRKCQQSFPEMMPGWMTNKLNTTRSLFDHQQWTHRHVVIKWHLRCPIIVLSESLKPPLVSSKKNTNYFTGQSMDTLHAMEKQSHAGRTAADMAAAPVIHDHILQSSEQTTQVLWKKNSPGQSRGPKDPLTKRVSLPAHRELLEEWWLG